MDIPTTLGNIRITGRIGSGGMGDVYVGYDVKLDRKVAVKAIRSDRLDSHSRVLIAAQGATRIRGIGCHSTAMLAFTIAE